MTQLWTKTPLSLIFIDSLLLRIRRQIQYGVGECHKVKIRYIKHLYSDVGECSPSSQAARVRIRAGDISAICLRVHDIYVTTMVIGMLN